MGISKAEKVKFKNQFKSVKTNNEFRNIVYDLYVNHGCSYNNIVKIGREVSNKINIQLIIKILEEFDVKRCSKGKDCKSPDGCIQSRDNFNRDNQRDGKHSMCGYCKKFDKNFKRADQTKQNYMLEFQKIKEKGEQDIFLINLYKKEKYNHQDLATISLRQSSNIINLLEKADLKRCSKGEDCKSPEGCIQSRDNFDDCKNWSDGKQYSCIYCQKFEYNSRYTDQTKRNYMLEFLEIKDLEKQDIFLINLYKKEKYNHQDLATISLRQSSNIINLLEKADLKRCSKCNIIHNRSNFIKSKNKPDGLINYCKMCHYEYCLNNKDHIKKRSQIYNLINSERISEQHKNYRNRFGEYDSYAHQLKPYGEKVRRDPNSQKLIQVQCKYNNCSKWFNPTNQELGSRIGAINGRYTIGTEQHFYCSQECKDSCSLYGMKASELILHHQLKNKNLSEIEFNRMQTQIRSLLINIRNPDYCNHCGKPFDVKDLILHHITPVADNYMFEADPDNLIFVCKDCHTELHQKDGCQIGQLRDYSMENKLCFDTGKKVKSN